jgi:DNA repair exonuclease SbcCD nuclease subunit
MSDPAPKYNASALSADQRPLVLAHSSDVHLGDDSLLDPAPDRLVALRQIIATAEAAEAHVLLLAGDTFDNLRLPQAFLDSVRDVLAATQLDIVILPGNHDPLLDDSVYARGKFHQLANVAVIGPSGDCVSFAQYELGIWGRAHVDYGDMRPLADPPGRTRRWNVVMAHGHYVDDSAGSDRHQLRRWRISRQEIEATQADYLALGHWNRPVEVATSPVPAWYSGSPQLAKTINIIRLADDQSAHVSRRPLADLAGTGQEPASLAITGAMPSMA